MARVSRCTALSMSASSSGSESCSALPRRNARAASASPFLKESQITPELLEKLRGLGEIAAARGQTLAQMALVWDLRNTLTSVIIGASRPAQITENVKALEKRSFTQDELDEIDRILKA